MSSHWLILLHLNVWNSEKSLDSGISIWSKKVWINGISEHAVNLAVYYEVSNKHSKWPVYAIPYWLAFFVSRANRQIGYVPTLLFLSLLEYCVKSSIWSNKKNWNDFSSEVWMHIMGSWISQNAFCRKIWRGCWLGTLSHPSIVGMTGCAPDFKEQLH